MKKILLGFLLALSSFHYVSAQDQSVFSQFFMNPYIYNPAYVGVEGHSAVFAMHRAQWIGLDGAPQLSHANFHTPLKGGMAFGAMAYSDTKGPLIESGAKATVGYLIALDKKHYLRFGMSLGGGYSAINVDAGNDPTLLQLNNTSHIMADFGISYHFGHFNVGLSVPNLIGREVISPEGLSPVTLAPQDNLMLKINYRGHLNDDYAIEPHLIYRHSTVNLPQYEAALIVHIKHLVWAGASFRQDAGVAALVGFKLKEKFGIGFAYELGNSELNNYSSGSAEIHIGYHINDKRHHHGHSHSFIKSHRKSKAEREKEAERKRLALEKKQEEAEAKKQESAELRATQKEAERKRVAEQRKAAASLARAQELEQKEQEQSIEIEETEEKEEVTDVVNNQEKEVMKEVESEEPTEAEKDTSDNLEVQEATEEPSEGSSKKSSVVVKRGSHFIELKVGHHVVAGVFAGYEHAENLSDQLFNRGFHDAKIGFVTETGKFYTVIYESSDYESAETEKDRMKTASGLNDIWVLTVE